jgi:hypothetical protein
MFLPENYGRFFVNIIFRFYLEVLKKHGAWSMGYGAESLKRKLSDDL